VSNIKIDARRTFLARIIFCFSVVLSGALTESSATAQDKVIGVDEANFRQVQPDTLIPVDKHDTFTIKADEAFGIDGASITDPVTESSINPGLVNQIDAGLDFTPQAFGGISSKTTYRYTRSDALHHPEYSYQLHDFDTSFSGKLGIGTLNLGVGASALIEDGAHLVDTYAVKSSYAIKIKHDRALLAHYSFTRNHYHFDRSDSDLHQGGLFLVSPFGQSGSYAVGGLALSYQKAKRDQLYIGVDPVNDFTITYDTQYRPFDYFGQTAVLLLRLRNLAGKPLLTGGLDVTYQRQRYLKPDYAIEPVDGAKRHDDIVNLSAFVQYRLSNNFYTRLTLLRQDDFSNLQAVARHGFGANISVRFRFAR
jgi:hypothetical protein